MNLLIVILSSFLNLEGVPCEKCFTLDFLGACQGVQSVSGDYYLYGDRESGVIRKYALDANDSLLYAGEEYRLTIDGKDVINHPTGMGLFEGNVFIGNSERVAPNSTQWLGMIYWIDWNKLKTDKVLDGAVLNVIEDDQAVQGTRPETVSYNDKTYIATADYGPKGNEVRLYDPLRLQQCKKTSEPGVVAFRFKCTPWVQNLHWIPAKGILILVQNQIEGRKWRLTFVDLHRSVEAGESHIIKVVDFAKEDELEGFYLINTQKGIGASSSRKQNACILDLSLKDL